MSANASLFYKPPTLSGGFRRFLTDNRRHEASSPIWAGGFALQRDLTDLSLVKMKDNYADLRARILGISVSGTDPHANYAELPTTFVNAIRGAIPEWAYLASALVGIFSMPYDSDFATYPGIEGDQLGLVDDSHLLMEVATTVPAVAPLLTTNVAGTEYGNTWATAIADAANITGVAYREIMNTIGNKYVGQLDAPVSATPGDVNADVVLMLSSPVVFVPSS